MSLNNILRTVIFLLPVLFFSCGDKEPADRYVKINYDDPKVVLSKAREAVGDDIKFALKGYYTKDSLVQIVAGEEISGSEKWGIKFYLLKEDFDSLRNIYQTDLLEGSFTDGLTEKINLTGIENDLIYYNSQDFFLGSGGGEVFSYLIDFNKNSAYYAHLFTEPGDSVSLYLSENIDNPVIKNFFLKKFKEDFPALQIVSDDVNLEI